MTWDQLIDVEVVWISPWMLVPQCDTGYEHIEHVQFGMISCLQLQYMCTDWRLTDLSFNFIEIQIYSERRY